MERMWKFSNDFWSMQTWGSEIMNSWALAALAASITSSLEMLSSGKPYAMFSPTDTENKTGSCNSEIKVPTLNNYLEAISWCHCSKLVYTKVLCRNSLRKMTMAKASLMWCTHAIPFQELLLLDFQMKKREILWKLLVENTAVPMPLITKKKRLKVSPWKFNIWGAQRRALTNKRMNIICHSHTLARVLFVPDSPKKQHEPSLFYQIFSSPPLLQLCGLS